jgi:hypothetical protein
MSKISIVHKLHLKITSAISGAVSIQLLLIFILMAPGNASAQNDGTANTGLSFLKLGVGARSIAMGEAFASLTDDGTAFIYNPARLSVTENNNVTVMHNKSMTDLITNFVGAKFRIGKVGLGIGLLQSSVEGIEVRNIPGAALDRFDAQNFSGGLSASMEVYKNLYVGLTGKLLYEKIYVDEASGFGFDIGTNYLINNISLSLVIANIGSMNELRSVSTKVPTSVRFGGAYTYRKNNLSFAGALEGFKVIDGGLFHANIGGEAGYKDFIFIRLGYQLNYENKGFSTGLGIKYKSLYLDYAFSPYSSSFGTGNSVSLGFNF